MLIRQLLLICVVFGITKNYGQADTTNRNNSIADTLSFSIQQIKYDSVKKEISNSQVKPKLMYDFMYQYPYYQIESKKWAIGDQIQFHIKNLPSRGYLYFFSVDGLNTPKIQSVIAIDSSAKLPIYYPDSLKVMSFEADGKERICLWYSTDTIKNSEKLIKGIELTTGSFVKRNNRQIGKDLLLPNYGWYMLYESFGFTTNPEMYSQPDKFVLPVIIEFEIAKSLLKKKKQKQK